MINVITTLIHDIILSKNVCFVIAYLDLVE